MFGIYNGKNLYLPSPFSEWILDKKDFLRDDPNNAFNQGVLDSIIDDDESQFREIVSPFPGWEKGPNQKFSMTNYKIPELISNNPTYASLCALFGAEKCFSTLAMICPDGISSEQFRQKDNKDRSPIHFACAGGNLNIVRMLYEANYNLNMEDYYGYKPAHYSAMAGTTDIMKYLWTKGANILDKLKYVMSPFQVACLYGNLDIIKLICESIDQDDKVLNECHHIKYFENKAFLTPLHFACEGGHSNVVDYLLSKNKEIGKKHLTLVDHESRTPLEIACQNGFLECVKSLVKFGALSLDLEKSQTALFDACANGFPDIVTFLLRQKEININKVNSNDMTALEIAVINGQLEPVKVLIQNGALKNKTENEIGDLFLAACGSNNDLSIVKYLNEQMNIPYQTMGDTFMRQACKIENEELVNFLIEKNCSFKNIKINDFNFTTKWTPFMTFLKNKGLDFMNVNSNVGVPIIIKTIKYGSMNSIKKLISEGVELNKEIVDKYDLIKFSCAQGKTKLFHLLIQYNPNMYDPTLFLNELITKFISYKTKTNKKRNKEYFDVAKILLDEYKANPNNKSIINELVSNCCIELLELLSEFGASFDFCMIDFDVFRRNNKNSIVFELFKEKNVDFNTLKCKNCNLLLTEAIKNNDTYIIDQLLSCGASIDGKTNIIDN